MALQVRFDANTKGVDGNRISVSMVNPAGVGISVATVVSDFNLIRITVTAGQADGTNIAATVNADPTASLYVTASGAGTGATMGSAAGTQNLLGGSAGAGEGQYYSEVSAEISITCPLGNATIGVPYDSTIVVSGGTPPYTFIIISGSLPPGLTLNASTGEITGTPLASGTFGYTIQVTDADGNIGSGECSITIPPPACATAPAPAYTVTMVLYPDPKEQVGS